MKPKFSFLLIGLLLLMPGMLFATEHFVSIPGFSFSPASLTIAQGDTVTWTNDHTINHTTTSDDGTEWDSGVMAPGATFSYVFVNAGTFPYHCTIHPSMVGTITVEPQEVPTLSEWGMIIFGLLLLAFGTLALVRRQRAATAVK